MKATKRDFKKLAELCKYYNVPRRFIDELCDLLKVSNPAFRYDLFKEACGYNDRPL
jgi:hypothetical protein